MKRATFFRKEFWHWCNHKFAQVYFTFVMTWIPCFSPLLLNFFGVGEEYKGTQQL